MALEQADTGFSKVLVTGANGFVGQALCTELIHRHYRVSTVSRQIINKHTEVCSYQIIDINAQTDWSSALLSVDTVIHLAARVHIVNDPAVDPLVEFCKINVDGTLNLGRQAAKAGIKRFIFVSSIKINGESTNEGKPLTEDDAPNPHDAYAISKLEAEQGLLQIAQQTGMEVVIIRPPLVYGPNVKANFASMLKTVQREIPLPLGAINNKRSFIYVENLVSFIMLCIQHPLAANQTFLVSDGHDLSTTELLRECAYALGVKSRLVPVPQKLLEIIASMLGKRDVAQKLCGNLQVDITKARTLLGWMPPVSMSEGLKRTVADLCKTGKQ